MKTNQFDLLVLAYKAKTQRNIACRLISSMRKRIHHSTVSYQKET